uniref:Uncharacterized protein n=1 Tax=Chenopodium quinoa TaxID=63459 RepID=A0A803LGN3_CHEQI
MIKQGERNLEREKCSTSLKTIDHRFRRWGFDSSQRLRLWKMTFRSSHLSEMGEEATKVVIPESVLKKQKREEEWTLAKEEDQDVQKKKRVEIRKLITNYSSKFVHIN